MPELPEVETIRLGLLPFVTGRQIEGVEVLHPRAVRRADAGLDPVVGKTIRGVARRGKYMWFDLGDLALVAHLGMSGQFRVGGAENPHRRASLLLDGGARLDFVDQRTFGHLLPEDLVDTDDGLPGGLGTEASLVPKAVAHIGRDLLDPAVDLRRIAKRVKAKDTEVKRALLDQTVASGVGNIYADEALFAAQVNGKRATGAMSERKIAEVYEAARDVMERAVAVGGTSFDELYVGVDGSSGYFERSLNVYGRQGTPCPRCGTILTKEPFMGRSSHYCPRCQSRTR